MADMALVPLQGADEILMTTQDHPARPLLIHDQPREEAFLQPGEPSRGHGQLLAPAGVDGRGFGVV
jgi:hypothetical protein